MTETPIPPPTPGDAALDVAALYADFASVPEADRYAVTTYLLAALRRLAAAEERDARLRAVCLRLLEAEREERRPGHDPLGAAIDELEAALCGQFHALDARIGRITSLRAALARLVDAAARLPLSTALLAGELAAARAALGEGETPPGRPAPQERCPECNRLVGFCEHTTGGRT